MTLTLFDRDLTKVQTLRTILNDSTFIRTTCSELRDLPTHDYLVSPGNSYGIMDGGFDLAVRNLFGQSIQDNLQWYIASKLHGRLPVGDIAFISTNREQFKQMIYIPTMEIPQKIYEEDIYLIFVKLFRVLKTINTEFSHLTTVACPLLGCGAGGIPVDVTAKIIKKVTDDFLL